MNLIPALTLPAEAKLEKVINTNGVYCIYCTTDNTLSGVGFLSVCIN